MGRVYAVGEPKTAKFRFRNSIVNAEQRVEFTSRFATPQIASHLSKVRLSSLAECGTRIA